MSRPSPLRIAILGDREPSRPTHGATDAALSHAAHTLSLPVEARWLPTPALEAMPEHELARFAGFLVAPASGRGTPWTLPLVVSPDYPGAAIVSGEDAASLGLALSEIPGEASLVEALTGRAVPHRRALCRVTFPFPGDDAARSPSAIVEVLFPK